MRINDMIYYRKAGLSGFFLYLENYKYFRGKFEPLVSPGFKTAYRSK